MTGQANTTLDPKTHEFLEGFGQIMASVASLPVAEKRAEFKRLFSLPQSDQEPVGSVVDKTIVGPNGEIDLRIFTPEGEGPFPVMVYFHHGGWTFGSLDECEPVCRRMTNATGVIIIAVDYRLAPENKYPTPLFDAFAATQWAIQHAQTIKGDPSCVGVGGESAGGNLAAAVTLMARDIGTLPVAFQTLFYPILTCDLDPKAYENSPDKHLLTLDNMKWFSEQYLTNQDEEKKLPYTSPVKASDYSGLPRALILTAEWDPLRFEGQDYAQSLVSHHVDVQYNCYPNVIHGFLGFPIYPEEAAAAMAEIKGFIKR